MSWNEIIERVVWDVRWFWYLLEVFENLKCEMFLKGLWKESVGFVLRGEVVKDKIIVKVNFLFVDFDIGEIVLKFILMFGDVVYYEEGDKEVIENLLVVLNVNEFRIKVVKVNFFCIDFIGYYLKGDVVKYVCLILIDDNVRFID